MKTIFPLLSLWLLSGCASFVNQLDGTYWSREQCLAADWKAYGVEDGRAGVSTEEAHAFYQARCVEEHRVAVDWAKLDSGHRVGLKEYCTYDGGLRAGKAGDAYSNVCPPGNEAAFLKGYGVGLAQFQRLRIQKIDRDLIRAAANRDKAYLKLQSLRHSPTATEADITRVQRELDGYIDEIASLQSERVQYE